MRTYVGSDIKVMNRVSVFEYVREKEGQTVSRPEIARALHITEPTVLKITNRFQEIGLLREEGEAAVTTVGRKPNLLKLHPEAAFAVGVHYNGDSLRISVINLNYENCYFYEKSLKCALPTLFDEVLPREFEMLKVPKEKVLGIGIALPVVVNTKIKALEQRNLSLDCGGMATYSHPIESLARKTGYPVFLENDVNAAAVAKYKESSSGDFVYLLLDTGLGSGLVLDGKLRRGAHFSAGEIGYMTADADFVLNRDQPGYFERRLSASHFRQRFGLELSSGTKLPPEKHAEAVSALASDLALIIANIANVLDIDMFVLGGCMVEILGSELSRRVKENCSHLCLHEMHIFTDTSPETIAKGMGAIVINHTINDFLAD